VLRLPIAPDAGEGLCVNRWVPRAVEEKDAVRTDEVDAGPPRLCRKQEDECWRVAALRVEAGDEVSACGRRCAAVEPRAGVAAGDAQSLVGWEVVVVVVWGLSTRRANRPSSCFS
jgi:hypothetical protein